MERKALPMTEPETASGGPCRKNMKVRIIGISDENVRCSVH